MLTVSALSTGVMSLMVALLTDVMLGEVILPRKSVDRKTSSMAIQRCCDCCRNSVDVIDTEGLCMVCYMVQILKSVIAGRSKLSEEQINNLAVAVQITVLSLVIARLRVPGQEHPLALELEQWMAPRAEQRH